MTERKNVEGLPRMRVKLVGTDGNAFAVLGRVKRAMDAYYVPTDKQEELLELAKSGDYMHLLAVLDDHFDIY